MADAARGRLLRVLTGPQRGAELSLSGGTYAIGSGDDDVILADPKVTPRHASLTVSADDVRCTPGGGTVRLEDGEAPGQGVRLRPFQPFALGGTVLAVGPADEAWPEIDFREKPATPPPPATPVSVPETPGRAEAPTEPVAVEKTPVAEKVVEVADDPGGKPRGRRVSAGLWLLLVGLLNGAALGAVGWWVWMQKFESAPASDDLVSRVLERVRDLGDFAQFSEDGARYRVEGSLTSEPRREMLLARLDSLGVHVERRERSPVVVVDGWFRAAEGGRELTASLGRLEALSVREADGQVGVTGTLLSDVERRGLIDSLGRVRALTVRQDPTPSLIRLEGSVDRTDLEPVRRTLWRLGVLTVMVRADGRVRVEGYCRARDRRKAIEQSLAGVAPPDSPRLSWALRSMEDLVTAARNARTEKGLTTVDVREGALGQLLVEVTAAPVPPAALDALVRTLRSDPRVLDVREQSRPATPATAAVPRAAVTAAAPAPAPERPAPKTPSRRLPPIRSLHVGETRSVTLRDGRRLFLGAPVGDGFAISEILADRVVLLGEDGRRVEVLVNEDVGKAEETDDDSTDETP